MANRKALRSTRNGMVFPMNEDMLRSDETELVYVDENGKVVEPEDVGPADAPELPEVGKKEEEKEEEKEETTVSDAAETSSRRGGARRKTS